MRRSFGRRNAKGNSEGFLKVFIYMSELMFVFGSP